MVEARKEAMVGDTLAKEAAQETGTAPTQSPAAEVIDGDDKVASSAATAPFPMASIGLITLLCQLETMIQVCPSSSPRGSRWYVMASRDYPLVPEYLPASRQSVTFVLLILAVGDSEPARRDGKVAK
jgi:hypothetical protein